ncbi:MAG: hypothetical protein M9894_28055 [Planctomycetes bacterium]|nr:hypothetical protein [Planctomycetota bacterium]
MTDARLREVERRWRESGNVDDEAAFLRERVRVGALPDERLRVAAGLGHPAALRASRVEALRHDASPRTLADLVAAAGTPACQRAALIVTEAALKHVVPAPPAARDALRRAQALAVGGGGSHPALEDAQALLGVVFTSTGGKRVEAAERLARATLQLAAFGRRVARGRLQEALDQANRAFGRGKPLLALRARFAPWLLQDVVPAEPPPAHLLMVEEALASGPGTQVAPAFDLLQVGLPGHLELTVEVRAPGAPPRRCFARAGPRDPYRTAPETRERVLWLLLPPPLVPVGAEIWEVGP